MDGYGDGLVVGKSSLSIRNYLPRFREILGTFTQPQSDRTTKLGLSKVRHHANSRRIGHTGTLAFLFCF